MSGIFGTMNIANSGMRAMQESVNTTSNNIANAHTEGYARKRVTLVTNTPMHLPGVGEISTGVRTDGVMRIRDVFTDRQVRLENGRFETFSARNSIYDQLEIVFNEPSQTGISASMQEMWNSWQELGKTPESLTARTIVIEQSTTLADRFNHTAVQLEGLQNETLFQVSQSVFEVNTRLEQLKAVDKQIMEAVNREMTPNDLLDQRDLLLDQLSGFLTYSVKDQSDGGISLKLDGQEVLYKTAPPTFSVVQSVREIEDEDGVNKIEIQIAVNGDTNQLRTLSVPLDQTGHIQGWKAGTLLSSNLHAPSEASLTEAAFTMVVAGEGRIHGLQTMMTEVGQSIDKLDTLASGMAELINTVHSNEGEHPNFFVSGSGGKIRAATIRVNPDLKDHPQDIIAGKTADGPEGDGSRALAIARLRDVSLNAAGYSKDTFSFSSQSGDTSDARYRSMIAELGVSSAYSRNMAENETSLLNQLHQRRESVMGVSVDEEISALIKFQNGYQANARVMSTLVSMLDTLISMAR